MLQRRSKIFYWSRFSSVIFGKTIKYKTNNVEWYVRNVKFIRQILELICP